MIALSASLQKRPSVIGDGGGELAVGVEGRRRRRCRRAAGLEVVQRRSGGMWTRPVPSSVVTKSPLSTRKASGVSWEVGKERLVGPAEEVGARHLGDDFVVFGLLVDGGEAGFGHDVDDALGLVAHGDVGDAGAGADGEVLGERPGGRRPDEQIGLAPGGGSPGADFDTEGDGGVLDVLVVRPGLEVGKRRGQLPAVRHDAMRLVDSPLVPELLEHPPDRLHEVAVHRLVVVVEIDPAAHARHGAAPFADVAHTMERHVS